MIEQQQQKLAEEDEPYQVEDISVIISTDNHSVRINKAILQISQQGFTILEQLLEQNWLTIFTSFTNTTSIGNNQTNLMIFVGDNQQDEEEQKPQIFNLIEAKTAANLNLSGKNYTVTFDLSGLGMNVLKQINDILVNYMGQANQRISNYQEDEDFAEMISAQDIDQSGNIISKKDKNSSESENEEN